MKLEKNVYTPTEVGNMVGIQSRAIRKNIKDKFPNAYRTSPNRLGRWRIPKQDVENYLKQVGLIE